MADIFQGQSLTFPTLNTFDSSHAWFQNSQAWSQKFLRSMSEFPLLELRILKLNILSVPTLNILIVPKAWFQNSQAWSQDIRNLVLRIPTLELIIDTFSGRSLTILVLDILTINTLDVRIVKLYLRRFPSSISENSLDLRILRPFIENTHARWLFSAVDLWHFPRSILWQCPRLISKFPTLNILAVPNAWFQNSQTWSQFSHVHYQNSHLRSQNISRSISEYSQSRFQNISTLDLRIPTLELRLPALKHWKYPRPDGWYFPRSISDNSRTRYLDNSHAWSQNF